MTTQAKSAQITLSVLTAKNPFTSAICFPKLVTAALSKLGANTASICSRCLKRYKSFTRYLSQRLVTAAKIETIWLQDEAIDLLLEERSLLDREIDVLLKRRLEALIEQCRQGPTANGDIFRSDAPRHLRTRTRRR